MTAAGPNYTLLKPTASGVGGGIMQVPESAPSYVTIYVDVDDLEAKLAEIDQLGGKVVIAPTAIDDNMSFALFADPEGTVVGLLRTSVPMLDANAA